VLVWGAEILTVDKGNKEEKSETPRLFVVRRGRTPQKIVSAATALVGVQTRVSANRSPGTIGVFVRLGNKPREKFSF